MIRVGHIQTLPVLRLSRHGAYLGTEEDNVLLPRKEVPEDAAEGHSLRVFVYADSEDRPTATLRQPKAVVGAFAPMQVVSLAPYGAFVDWGLDKDLLVPHNLQHAPMERGRTYVVHVLADERTERLVGTTILGPRLREATDRFRPQQRVQCMVYDVSPLGARVVVDDGYGGLIYPDPAIKRPQVGSIVVGHVIRVRPDGRADISLTPLGSQAEYDDQVRLVTALMKRGGFLPLGDDSDPDEVRDLLGMSKKAFKRAVGRLYRARKVVIEEGGVRLVETSKGAGS
jgi:predicted RNA-binding protein (virulence factor B family)